MLGARGFEHARTLRLAETWPIMASRGGAEGGKYPVTAAASAAAITLGSMHTLTFKDGTKWSLQVWGVCGGADG